MKAKFKSTVVLKNNSAQYYSMFVQKRKKILLKYHSLKIPFDFPYDRFSARILMYWRLNVKDDVEKT